MVNRWLSSLILSASVAVLVALGANTAYAYSCPAAATCAGKTCPPGNPTCTFDKDANYCNCS